MKFPTWFSTWKRLLSGLLVEGLKDLRFIQVSLESINSSTNDIKRKYAVRPVWNYFCWWYMLCLLRLWNLMSEWFVENVPWIRVNILGQIVEVIRRSEVFQWTIQVLGVHPWLNDMILLLYIGIIETVRKKTSSDGFAWWRCQFSLNTLRGVASKIYEIWIRHLKIDNQNCVSYWCFFVVAWWNWIWLLPRLLMSIKFPKPVKRSYRSHHTMTLHPKSEVPSSCH